MQKEMSRIWISRLLMAFVLVTIGFSIGRRTAPLPVPDEIDPAARAAATQKNQVTVYAAHMTFRCPGCTQIEWLARELVENEFAAELADGRLVLRVVDYTSDAAFARRYDISSSTIVVARNRDGGEQDYQRLDEVWTKLRDRDEFFDYVRTAILSALYGEDDA